MNLLLNVREAIYNYFHASSCGPAYFFRPENADAYAAYYTSMYLIQDTGEAVLSHMTRDFSPDPIRAYLEFWGLMQAIVIQQDAIKEMHDAVVGCRLENPTPDSNWHKLRELRNICAGHPANRNRNVPASQRTFMGRSFGNYDGIQYELWDKSKDQIAHPTVNLCQMIGGYDREASEILTTILSSMRSKWL